MEKVIEKKAATVELAIEGALLDLGITRDRAEVEIISKGSLFTKAHVKVSVIDTAASVAEDFINGILEKMGLTARASAIEEDGIVKIEISGEDSGAAIGYRGEALDALQYLVLTYLNQEKCGFKKVVVDSENYREKRRETLTVLAGRLAEKAQRTCRKVVLEPMNPFERRVIHSALAESEIAETISEGDEPNRHVVIIPKGVEIKEDRPRRDDRRDGSRGRNDRRDGSRGRNDRRERFNEQRPSDGFARKEEEEVPDGKVYRYFTETDDFEKAAEVKTGPPKFKSFGGRKKR